VACIYVLAHPTNQAVSKIGRTTISAESRSRYHNIHWSVFREFQIGEQHCDQAEKFIHLRLIAENVNIGLEGPKEIYSLTPTIASETVQKLLSEFINRYGQNQRDDDYWNYLATPEERDERDRQLEESRRARVKELDQAKWLENQQKARAAIENEREVYDQRSMISNRGKCLVGLA
jgi:hypothetical protein